MAALQGLKDLSLRDEAENSRTAGDNARALAPSAVSGEDFSKPHVVSKILAGIVDLEITRNALAPGSEERAQAQKNLEKERLVLEAACSRPSDHCCDDSYVKLSAMGCHVAHLNADWVVATEPLEEGMFGDDVSLDDLPEISLDHESGLVSVVNSSKKVFKCFNITVGGACLPAIDGHDRELIVGSSVSERGETFQCVSFVILVKPYTVVDVCYLAAMPELTEGGPGGKGFLVSDIKTWTAYTDINRDALVGRTFDFPLQQAPEDGFLCSQGCGGLFTHFFPSNYFAIDIECTEGTPIVAVADGQVIEVRQHESVQGILTSNLFHWNSLLLKVDEETFVEYVHIQKDSVKVTKGEQVVRGQLLCRSGSVGFSPKPHLHLQVTGTSEAAASSVPYRLLCRVGDRESEPKPHTPRAGERLFPV
mmetsp:Transcript_16297/g.29806  ORF Transcript_16297/g.29806 Transcript_16297/m.29806 type:complete len:421 (-) Transcript_16297:200-1462(-)